MEPRWRAGDTARVDAAIEAAFEAERREHPDVELRDPEDDETANADADADPGARRRSRRACARSVDTAAVSSGAIVGADVNASEAWRVAGAAYYDTQRTIPPREEARNLPSNPPQQNRNRGPNRKSRSLARRIPPMNCDG